MSSRMVAVRAGLQRGWIEFRQSTTNGQDLWSVMFFPIISLVVMFLLRHNTVPGTGFSLGSQSIPGILGMNVVLNGMVALALSLTMDREDGTLLRAKATPNGMIGYLTGKVLSRTGTAVVGLLIPLIPALFLFDGLELGGVSSWVTLVWVLALGLVALLPIGAVLGSVFNTAQGMGFVTLPIMMLMGVSGVFYPISAFPEWLQWLAQVFPLYWLGLGLRSAMLPETLAATEVGESWRHLETIGVLGLWAIAGLLLAPVVLRRMARRESGSAVAVRRQKAMQRTM
ncbi:ABC transporter permease [Planotetraspora mira]|uniref:Transport permease protein n=1 Tax=Planotetraspora mira TaxID=58121 RepID=A0A8J3X8R7_9ACTN|nr:ABC transporter permease [Planotetraspora mira]GII31566.1 transport permease protein [Planotetraspora mira]